MFLRKGIDVRPSKTRCFWLPINQPEGQAIGLPAAHGLLHAQYHGFSVSNEDPEPKYRGF